MLNLLADANPIEHVQAHPIFHIGSFVFNNHMFMATVAGGLMLLIFPRLFRRPIVGAPTGWANLFESILEFLRVEVFRPALKENTDRFVPFLWTVFFFILFCNLLGTIPTADLFGLIQHGFHQAGLISRERYGLTVLGGSATGNINTTGVLAMCAFLFIHINGIRQVYFALLHGTYGHHGHHEEHSADGEPSHESAMDLEHMRGDALAADVPQHFGAIGDPTHHYADDEHQKHPGPAADSGHGLERFRTHYPQAMVAHPGHAVLLAVPLYFWNFAPHPFRPKPGEGTAGWFADIPVWAMLLILELFGAVIKPIALALRLFANMIAGHLVLGMLIALIVIFPSFYLQFAVFWPVAMLCLLIWILEIFVAFLQAYIFTFLTTLFLASAVAPEH